MIDQTFFDQPAKRRGTGCVKWDAMPADDVIPMWVADMDFAVAPAIQKAIKDRAAHPVFGYTLVPDSYYESVIQWFKRRHGWTIERDWILYTTGVVPAASATIKALTLPGEKVLVQTPAYNCFFSSIRNQGCEILETRLLREGDRSRWTSTTSSASVPTRRPLFSCSVTHRIRRAGCGRARNWSG